MRATALKALKRLLRLSTRIDPLVCFRSICGQRCQPVLLPQRLPSVALGAYVYARVHAYVCDGWQLRELCAGIGSMAVAATSEPGPQDSLVRALRLILEHAPDKVSAKMSGPVASTLQVRVCMVGLVCLRGWVGVLAFWLVARARIPPTHLPTHTHAPTHAHTFTQDALDELGAAGDGGGDADTAGSWALLVNVAFCAGALAGCKAAAAGSEDFAADAAAELAGTAGVDPFAAMSSACRLQGAQANLLCIT